MMTWNCQYFLYLLLIVGVSTLEAQKIFQNGPVELPMTPCSDDTTNNHEHEVGHKVGSKVKRELTVSSAYSDEYAPRKEISHVQITKTLVPFGPPKVKVTQSQVEGVVGSNNVTLECFIDSFPKATIYWKKGHFDRINRKTTTGKYNITEDNLDHFQFKDRLRLQFLNLEVDDLGKEFYCVASNENGIRSEAISLSAPSYLETKAVPANGLLEVNLGSPVLLECEVKGFPVVVTYWFRNSTGEQLSWNDEYHVTEHKLSLYHYISRLHIRSARELDLTIFKCVSKNSFGESQHAFRIFEKRKNSEASIGKKLDFALWLSVFFLSTPFVQPWVK